MDFVERLGVCSVVLVSGSLLAGFQTTKCCTRDRLPLSQTSNELWKEVKVVWSKWSWELARPPLWALCSQCCCAEENICINVYFFDLAETERTRPCVKTFKLHCINGCVLSHFFLILWGLWTCRLLGDLVCEVAGRWKPLGESGGALRIAGILSRGADGSVLVHHPETWRKRVVDPWWSRVYKLVL